MHKCFRREDKEYYNQLKCYGELQADTNTGYLEHCSYREHLELFLLESRLNTPCILFGFSLTAYHYGRRESVKKQ